jgi:hypothetical protein
LAEYRQRIGIGQWWASLPVLRWKKRQRKVRSVEVANLASFAQTKANVSPQILKYGVRYRQIGLKHNFRSRSITHNQATFHFFETLQLGWQSDLNTAARPASGSNSTVSEVHDVFLVLVALADCLADAYHKKILL